MLSMVTSIKSPLLVDNDFRQNETTTSVQTNADNGAFGLRLTFAKTSDRRNVKRAEFK
jgi:hypothetical protein